MKNYDFQDPASGFYFNILDSGSVEITYKEKYHPTGAYYEKEEITIPSSVSYGGATYVVTKVGCAAFHGCTKT